MSCAKCGYTEFYRGKASALRNIGDFLREPLKNSPTLPLGFLLP
ncbi:zinc ribbon domain-containing protein [Alcanivorax sp.]